MSKPRKLSDEQVREIARRLEEGEKLTALASELQLNRGTLTETLQAAGFARPGRKALSDEQEREIATRYADGENSRQLAEAFSVSQPTILAALRRQQVDIRATRDVLSEDQQSELIRLWDEGYSVHNLIQHFGVHGNTVRRTLKKHERELEPRYAHLAKYTPETEAEIVRLYAAGVLPSELEKQFDCSRVTITDIVRRNGGKVRPKGEPLREWSEAELSDIETRWLAGESQESIAKIHGTIQTRISNLLRQRGIKKPTRREQAQRASNFKNYRVVTNRGYVGVKIDPDHPMALMCQFNGYVLEHRLVMAQQLGRPLLRSEHVHHIDGNRQNNDPSNLQLIQSRHGAGVRYRCRCCGSTDIEAIPFEDAS